ncbi:UNVERIFIED_CONTAM: putative protein S-acyltransferase 16 [Sesamum radiatum]|uniref:Protein S-acyltransferase n=1 Tax=Sesamum radiatum TaxID=300843 RepID=A0AAW2R5J9_SESRA
MTRGCKFSFHVAIVIAAIAYIYFSTVFVFIDRWFGLWSSPGMLHTVVFSFLAVMCISSYRLAIYTDPGRVPASFVPDIEDATNPIHEIKRKVLLLGSITVDSQNDIDDSDRIIHVISGLLLVPLSLALGFFLGWHIYLIVQNKTTIEYHEGVRAMWLAEKGGQLYSHPYDIGVYENLTAILGPTILCWLCPTTGHVGSGLRFQTKYDRLIVSSAPD